MLFDQGDRFPFFIDDSGAESRRNQAGVSPWAHIPLSFPTKCERSRLPCRSRAEGGDRIGILRLFPVAGIHKAILVE